MLKDVKVMFRIGKAHLDKVDQLAKRLKVKRSQTIRLCLDEGIEKYLEPGFKGRLQVLNTEFLNTIIGNLGNRIRELENPEGTLGSRVRESAEAVKRVDELRKQGKGKEANKLLREREKKGLATGYAYWPDSKGKLSAEEHEKMLDERYPDRKKQ